MTTSKSSHVDENQLHQTIQTEVEKILQQGTLKKLYTTQCPICQGELQIPVHYGATAQCQSCANVIEMHIEEV
ncbi:hypothetical protein [Bacillus sp. FDAARGOS_1420]|uniref:hypothetical protein n=1 Tax=Bacillus sp. FDAARGOS_1420 TaxID=2856338 RepID=UPI001C5B7797|nr:hypothetical protein [Bacillus sp. FDAARGOS_1420]MBW3496607.1 hypothetical protein [Bacillus sp. FDAARGOS_1420]